MKSKKRKLLLFAEDDEDDRLLVQSAFESVKAPFELYFAEDGEDLLNFLRHRGKYSDGKITTPDLILLDLNMPKKDGRQALREIKSEPELSCIPIIILTTSKAREDITSCYTPGANTFICKPQTYVELQMIAADFCHYWTRVAALPEKKQIEKSPKPDNTP